MLGLLTNGAPDLQREKIAASGLGSFFQAVAVSGEYDIGKPEPEIFPPPGGGVGRRTPRDNDGRATALERDIAGAKNAGMTAVWLKVAGSEEHAPVEPDFTITGLAELIALLEKLQN